MVRIWNRENHSNLIDFRNGEISTQIEVKDTVPLSLFIYQVWHYHLPFLMDAFLMDRFVLQL